MAWRNLWRNKRRTIITIASVFFGVLLSAYMTSMQVGSYAQYIATVVNSYSGYLQIQQRDYWDEKIINNSFVNDMVLAKTIDSHSLVTQVTPRFETFALASSREMSRGVMVMGIDAQREDAITRLHSKMKSGRYLQANDNEVVIGNGLARLLRLSVGDTLVLIGQGYHGVSAAGQYVVCGILKHPSYELDKMVVYMDITRCCQLFSAEGRLTSLVLMTQGPDEADQVVEALRPKLNSDLTIIDWRKMNDMLLRQIESDRQQDYIFKGVLYMIIGFGILSTIMMMMAERRREFGVMMAIGTSKTRLIAMVMLETLLIGIIGVIAGIAASIPAIGYFIYHPIQFTGEAARMFEELGFEPVMYFSMAPAIFVTQAVTVLIMTMLIGIYPIIHLTKMRVIKALH
jgi:ABC-type lipoprotein release transport system permease subunit